MNSQVSHQGHVNRRTFSESQGGGGSVVPYVSLHYKNDGILTVNSFLEAPGYDVSFNPWSRNGQGYYFGVDYILKGMSFLFNDFDSVGTNTVTVAIKRKLADGSNPAGVTLVTALLNIPNVGFNALFLGFYIDIWNITVDAGNFIYGQIVQRSGGTYNGANMALLFEKV